MTSLAGVAAISSAKGVLLVDRFRQLAAIQPNRPALRFTGERGERELSYAELDARSSSLAHKILAVLPTVDSGVPLVAIRLPAGVDQVVALLAVWKAGAAYLPLDSSLEREEQILSATAPALLIDTTFIDGADAAVVPLPVLDPSHSAYVIFTSGSTGTPKGVVVTHANIADLLAPLADELAADSNDIWSQTHSFAFGYSLWEIWGALATGACVAIVDEAVRKDPRQVIAALNQSQVSVLSLTPSGFAQWLALGEVQLPISLRLLVLSGEAAVPAHIAQWFARFGDAVRLVNTYAVTEAAGRVCLTEYFQGESATTAVVGKPVAGCELYLLDAEGGPVEFGKVGELYIAGMGVAAGYFADPKLSTEKFVQVNGVRCYRSGDLMRQLADGRYEFIGRSDQQIKLRGYRVEPAEIEAVIRSHPDVHDVAVGMVDRHGGESRLAAWYQSNELADNCPEFWPSLGEYQIYDDLLYDFMTADQVRVDAYQRAFLAQVQDKVVLDIGTGQDALLARLALAAGARKVYAVEVIPEAAARATQLVRDLGQSDRIEVICGDMQSITIPETVDICTQGIIGNIGSSDGIVPIWNSATRWFADTYAAIPSRCVTQLAAVELPPELKRPQLSSLAADYTETIFTNEGRRFDIRLCVRNFPESAKLSSASLFEDLNFQQPMQANDSGRLHLNFERDGRFDGVLLWTEVETMPGEVVDFLNHQQAWLPVYLPLLDTPFAVKAGDVATIDWSRETGADGVFPDYRFHLTLNDERYPEYITRHHEDALERNMFYRALHRSLRQQTGSDSKDLKTWLAAKLPDYMQPGIWQQLPALPLNSNGKLDRAALPVPRLLGNAYRAPVNGLQQDLADIWARLLNSERVGLGEDFFDAGGDSILAVRLTTEIQRLIDDTVFLTAVFSAPEIEALASYLELHHSEAVAKRYQLPAAPVGAPDNLLADNSTAVLRREPAVGQLPPLSFAQQSLWFLDQLYPGSTAANEQFAIRLTGHLDHQRLQNAWRQLMFRHDVLRTRFAMLNEELVQIVDNTLIVPIDVISGVLIELATTEISHVFDLQAGPLMRAKLLREDETEILLITVHHILADGLSVELIRDELARLYAGEMLSEPELQFADFAQWQRRALHDTGSHPSLAYWQQWLADAEYLLKLPETCAAVDGSGSGQSNRSELSIPAAQFDALRRQTKTEGVSVFVLLMAILRTVLATYTGQRDFLIGSPVTQRQSTQLQNMIGCMVNNVAFRNPLDPEQQTFAGVLQAEKQSVLAALDHAVLPFEAVVETIDPPREFGRHPLFQVLLMYEDRTSAAVSADGVEFSIEVPHPPRPSYWDMELTLVDAGEGLDLRAIFSLNPSRYSSALVQSLANSFSRVLTTLTNGFDVSLQQLPVSAPNEQQVLQSGPAADYPATCLHRLFEEQVVRTPDAIALLADGVSLSYAALNERTNRLAHGLLAVGLQGGDAIGLYMSRSVSRCVAVIAAFKAGLTIVPLDRSWPQERLLFMAEQADIKALVVEDPRHAIELSSELPGFTEAQFDQAAGLDNPNISIDPESGAWVLFTSGSTGQPKGVLYSHAAAVYRVRWFWEEYDFNSDERFVHRSSCNFIDAYWEIFGPLAHGATVVVPQGETDAHPAILLRDLQRHGVTHLAAVPSLLHTMFDIAASAGTAHQLKLRSVICSGEVLQPELLAQLRRALPAVRVFNTYGTTETWDVAVRIYEPGVGGERISIGRPLPGVAAWVLDQQLKPLPVGVWGELHVGGVGLSLGYVGSAATDCWLQRSMHSALADTGLYATGDRVRWTVEGELEIGGRCDRQINLRGFRIEPAEVEQHLLNYPGIAQAAVMHRLDPSTERRYLVAYLTAANVADQPEPSVLKEFLRGWLPALAVPVIYMWMPALPLTPSGKTDYLNLPEVDSHFAAAVATEYSAPVTATEKELAAIWEAILGVDQIGRDDDFFALHGHSLMAAKLMSRVCDAFAIDLPLQCLFEHPTLRGFAASVDTICWVMNSNNASAEKADAGNREVLRF